MDFSAVSWELRTLDMTLEICMIDGLEYNIHTFNYAFPSQLQASCPYGRRHGYYYRGVSLRRRDQNRPGSRSGTYDVDAKRKRKSSRNQNMMLTCLFFFYSKSRSLERPLSTSASPPSRASGRICRLRGTSCRSSWTTWMRGSKIRRGRDLLARRTGIRDRLISFRGIYACLPAYL